MLINQNDVRVEEIINKRSNKLFCPRLYAKKDNPKHEVIANPLAKPLTPSMKLKALVTAVKPNTVNRNDKG